MVEVELNGLKIECEFANTVVACREGLSHTQKCRPMLFNLHCLGKPAQLVDDMRNTYFDLDAALFDCSGRLIEIMHFSAGARYPYRSKSHAVAFLLEIESGFLEKNGIKVGARLRGLKLL